MKPLKPEKKKPQAPSVTRRLSSHENDALLGTSAEWEESCFRNAEYFTVCLILGNRNDTLKKLEYREFPIALWTANTILQWIRQPTFKGTARGVLIYAVTTQGRHFCIPPDKWKYYLSCWSEKHKEPR